MGPPTRNAPDNTPPRQDRHRRVCVRTQASRTCPGACGPRLCWRTPPRSGARFHGRVSSARRAQRHASGARLYASRPCSAASRGRQPASAACCAKGCTPVLRGGVCKRLAVSLAQIWNAALLGTAVAQEVGIRTLASYLRPLFAVGAEGLQPSQRCGSRRGTGAPGLGRSVAVVPAWRPRMRAGNFRRDQQARFDARVLFKLGKRASNRPTPAWHTFSAFWL
jgi:hypothetical protein